MAWITEAKRLNRKSGRKEFYFAIQWREGPKTRTKGLGFIEAKEAKQALKVFEGRLASGQAVEEPTPTESGSSREADEGTMTFGRYLDETYLPVVKRDKALKTAESATSAAKPLKAALGSRPISAVGYAEVDQYITARLGQGRRSRTVAIEIWLLRGCLAHAEACKVIAEMPRLPKVRMRDRKPHRFLTAEQSRRLLAELKPLAEQPHVVTRGQPPINRDRLTFLAVSMALNLGMRKREILTRRWEDVRWHQGKCGALLVGAQEAASFQVKTRRDRTVPLTPELRAELERALLEGGGTSEGWIFPSPADASKPRQDFGIALRRACTRAGVPVVGPHALRHTWASRLAMSGVDRRALMDLGGWSSGQMLDQVYAHVPSEHLEEVMAKSGLGLPEKDPKDTPS